MEQFISLKTIYINGIPQKTQRLKIIEARELLAKASINLETFSADLLENWIRKF